MNKSVCSGYEHAGDLPRNRGLFSSCELRGCRRLRWISRVRGWLATTSERKATNSALVCREAVFPITSPDRVVQCGVQRKSSVAVVLKAVTFGASRRQREHRFASVQRLNSCFFINTKDHCVAGEDSRRGRSHLRPSFRSRDRWTPCSVRVDAAEVELSSKLSPASPSPRCCCY